MKYPCNECTDMQCEICPHNSHMLDPTDAYRQAVKTGYYSTSIIPVKGKDGKIRYVYVKPGE